MTDVHGADQGGGGLEGRYANYFEVGHNAFEFFVVCGQVDPLTGAERAHTRIVTTPTYARALSRTLLESLSRYEGAFGPIPAGDDGT